MVHHLAVAPVIRVFGSARVGERYRERVHFDVARFERRIGDGCRKYVVAVVGDTGEDGRPCRRNLVTRKCLDTTLFVARKRVFVRRLDFFLGVYHGGDFSYFFFYRVVFGAFRIVYRCKSFPQIDQSVEPCHSGERRLDEEARVRAVAERALQVDEHLADTEDVAVGQTLGAALVLGVKFFGDVEGVRRECVEAGVKQVAEELAKAVEQRDELDTDFHGFIHHAEATLDVVVLDGLDEREEKFNRRNAEDGADGFRGHLVSGKGVGLVEVGETVAHGTVGLFGKDVEGFVGRLDAFLFADVAETAADLVNRQALEVKALHAAENRLRNLVDFGCRKDENHVGGRFFERLEKRVEGACREHVDFVDDENLVLADDGRVLHTFNHIADIVDARIGSGVDFVNVHRVAAGNVLAAIALTARVQRVRPLAVERTGEDSGAGGFAHTTGAGKEERMMKTTALDGVLQSLGDMFLTDHIAE